MKDPKSGLWISRDLNNAHPYLVMVIADIVKMENEFMASSRLPHPKLHGRQMIIYWINGIMASGSQEVKPLNNKEDFVHAYKRQVVLERDSRECNRDLLKKPSLHFLRSAKLTETLSSVCLEVLEQNVNYDLRWEPRKGVGVCRTFEDLMLQLADSPWKKEFYTFKLFSGYYRTVVAKSLLDADRLLELGGYDMDLSGHQMTLKQPPVPDRILRAAAELFLLALELQIQAEILCLVQAEGFKPCAVLKCRTSVAADNEASAQWIRSNCAPGHAPRPKPPPIAVDDPVYLEISDRSSSDSSISRRSLKSSSNETVSSGSVLDRNENVKEKAEPIYSVVKKTPKNSANADSYLYGFDPNHLHALRRSPNLSTKEATVLQPSPSEPPTKSPAPFPVTFSTFRPPNELQNSSTPRYTPSDSHYENIHLVAIGERVNMEKKSRPPTLSAIPVQLPSPPLPPGVNHLYANVSEANNDQRKFSGITASISSKYDALPSRRVTSPPNGHEGPMVVVGNRWQCLSCTSFNLQGTEICDICGKSRLKGAELTPLSTGGSQCPQCTLINFKGAMSCAACEQNLGTEEATYI
ncbi:hypothetical protein CAPTEDRAFT_202993 [Capitella teleta]|uniref:RanBP2-type domain-containing protein n=1 Tax=Capitella teleta TaxID=283909 RepID=R7TUF7_CAPTE|nr:hypothetical protein CAPTEDRAFT_202993 [Capitella teleta]|eukprot:ELT95106.1 hypothetical protein CAPTEDRAFT_202993 [Capitella teleta]